MRRKFFSFHFLFMDSDKQRIVPRRINICILLASLLFLCYSNTITNPWHLDSPHDISLNPPITIDNLMPETLWQTFFAYPYQTGKFYRPVANLSFALNWYIGQDNTLGYHIVNILIHILTALFLYQATLLLFRTPVLQKYSQHDACFIALLGTVLWAINPVQTQAVTYIVQRMASLGAMFSIWSIFWYLQSRLTATTSRRVRNLALCILCYFCAMGSKSNAVILPLSILLIEFTFFRKTEDLFSRNIRQLLVVISSTLVLLSLFVIIQQDYISYLFKPIDTRPFTLYERLLTEPGIVLFYLSLLFYPLYQRLSIDHDVTIAHSLFSSWTTLPSILLVVGLIILGLFQLRKRPILGFAILFFFINHLVESTIIPLELIFEHRNYLPSMFLFMPVAAGLLYLLHYSKRTPMINVAIIIFIPLLLIALGWNTYSRNSVWRSQESLWLDALQKAPNNARPLAKLGELAGWSKEKSRKQLALALGYYQQALVGYSPRTSFKAALLGNMGEIFFMYDLYDQAFVYYVKSLEENPNFSNSQYGLAKTLVLQGKFAEALAEVDRALITDPYSDRFLNLRGLILLWQNRPNDALLSIGKAMRVSRDKGTYFYNLGVAFSKAGYYDKARWFLKRSNVSSRNITILFSLLENSIKAEDQQETSNFAEKIIQQFSLSHIQYSLQTLGQEYRNVPISTHLIAPVLNQHIWDKVDHLSENSRSALNDGY